MMSQVPEKPEAQVNKERQGEAGKLIVFALHTLSQFQEEGPSVADRGFASDHLQAYWRACDDAELIAPPQYQQVGSWWSDEWRRWLCGLRQRIESIYDRLHTSFCLARERPHTLTGFQARLAAKVSLLNFCCWLNTQLHRELLAVADLLDWERLGWTYPKR